MDRGAGVHPPAAANTKGRLHSDLPAGSDEVDIARSALSFAHSLAQHQRQLDVDQGGCGLAASREKVMCDALRPDSPDLLEDDTITAMATTAPGLLEAETFSVRNSRVALGVLMVLGPDGGKL